MNSITAYDLIEEYLEGRLSHEARREFEDLMARDSELARELRSEQLIRSTLAKDSGLMPVPSTEPSSILTAKLAASSVGTSAGSGLTFSSIINAIFGTGTGLTILGIVGITGLLLGGLFLSGTFTLDRQELQPGDQIEDGLNGINGSSVDDLQPAVRPESEAIERVGRSDEQSRATDGAEAKRRGTVVTDNAPVSSSSSGAGTAVDESTTPPNDAADSRNVNDLLKRMEEQKQSKLPVVSNDSVHLKVNVQD